MDEAVQSKVVVSGWVTREVSDFIREVAERDERTRSFVVSKVIEAWYARQVGARESALKEGTTDGH
jgi:predicted transcriptional regulator